MSSEKVYRIVLAVARVLFTVAVVCCIVGGISCFIGTVAVAVFKDGTVSAGPLTFYAFDEGDAPVSRGTAVNAMAVSFIYCLSGYAVCAPSLKYFKELSAQETPFTEAGAAGAKKVGWRAVFCAFGGDVAAIIVQAVLAVCLTDVQTLDLMDIGGVGYGIFMLFVSLLLRLGTDRLAAQNEQKTV